MTKTAAFVLTLIAGLWALIGGITTLVVGSTMRFTSATIPGLATGVMTVVGIVSLVLGALMVVGSIQVKKEQRSGAILTLVVAIIFLVTLQLIPGILGLIGAILAFKK